MLSLEPLLLAALTATQSGSAQGSIDYLIDRLPPAGCAGGWDEKRGFVLDPASGELYRRQSEGERLTDSQWERALLVSQVFRFRMRWPAGVPFAMSVQEPSWTTDPSVPAIGAHIEALPRTSGLRSIEGGELIHGGCGLFEEYRRTKTDYQELGTLAPGKHRLEFSVSVESSPTIGGGNLGRSAWSHEPVAWSGPLSIEVEIVPTLDDAIPPVASTDLDDLVRRSLHRFPTSEGGVDDSSILIAFEAGGSDSRVLAETAFSMEIGLYRGTELLRQAWARADELGGFRPCPEPRNRWTAGAVELGPVRDPATAETDPIAGLVVRVRGVSRDVLRHWGAHGWWNGTVSVPLADLPVHR